VPKQYHTTVATVAMAAMLSKSDVVSFSMRGV
jgi:hypothetical protein